MKVKLVYLSDAEEQKQIRLFQKSQISLEMLS